MYNPRRNLGYEPIGEVSTQILESTSSDESVCRIYGYKSNTKRTIIFHCVSILLLAIPYFITSWYPWCKVIKYKRCALKTASFVLLYDSHGNNEILTIKTELTNLRSIRQISLKYFYHQHTKYIYVQERGEFVPLQLFVAPFTLEHVLENSDGLRADEQLDLLQLYGPNCVEVEVKSYWRLFKEEVFNPFYIFQLFSVTLWCFDDYAIYALCVFVLTMFSVITALWQTRKQSETLHDLIESSNTEAAHILRPNYVAGHKEFSVNSKDLVPGDLIIIPSTGCIMSCDAVLLTGNCIVNESMLTGESVPVTKTPPHASDELYNSLVHKRHTLFSGTHVLQTRYYGGEHVLARVVNTGFDTAKGALVKSILFPTPINLKFYTDSFKFVLVLAMIAATGMTYCLYLYISRHAPLRDIIIRALDIITIVVPPALPAAMTVGIVYSQNRLKKLGIFCMSPPRINISGKVKLACFDKTGTLTQEGLELYSVVPCDNAQFLEPVIELSTLDINSYLVQAMATCHSLTRIEGTITGDPLDLNMFESTQWELEEPGAEETERYDMLGPIVVKPKFAPVFVNEGGDFDLPFELGIIRQFPFSSQQQCMSVICKNLRDPRMLIFTKGAPEKLSIMCQSDSLPANFSVRLSEISAQGFRVIALAYKYMPSKFKWKEAQKIKRELIECDLIFLGLLIMQNTLKPETTPVITTLRSANIRTVMITGDNIMTAIAVARDCGMVPVFDKTAIINIEPDDTVGHFPNIIIEDLGTTHQDSSAVVDFTNLNFHFAMDGKTWAKLREFYSDLIPKLLLRTTVFARFQPDQKTQLIAQFQKLDYIVSMVGDGANDCGALKAAHVGISLSQAEASVAAPFTSSIPDISCILHLILEGRCALVTSFAVFKYMALYSLIQFFTVLILYANHSMLGDMQFLFIDLVITTTLAVTMGRQGPSHRLVPKRPMASLVSASNLVPLVLQVSLCGCIQLGVLYYLQHQKWFDPLPPGKEEVIICWENTVLFTVSCYQYLILALVYSKGKPYREKLINNCWLLLTSVILTCFVTWLIAYPSKMISDFFEIMYLPHRHEHSQRMFRDTLLAFPAVHLGLSIFVETCIADCKWFKKVLHFIKRKKQPKSIYKQLIRQTNFEDWLRSDYVTVVPSQK